MYPNESSIHSGNYYSSGVQRILSKLAGMGVAVPIESLQFPKYEEHFKPLKEFTYIEHAMLDWFEGRDYEQAQALIHYRSPQTNWHVIRELNDEHQLSDVSDGMLCPSLLDAIAAVINGSDLDVVRIDECKKVSGGIVVSIGGVEALSIEPICVEPFNLSIRDRVQNAFKGARHWGKPSLMPYAAKLPGFKDGVVKQEDARIEHMNTDAAMFLGFPGNWAFAMRNALKQVGIEVKQSQAQELAAVFLGAANWHQLTKHQNELNDSMMPVEVRVKMGDVWNYTYYHTTEEAIFATGNAIRSYPESVSIESFSLSLNNERAVISVSTQRELRSTNPRDLYLLPSCIECGGNDYWDCDGYGSPELAECAKKMLDGASDGKTSAVGVLYDGKGIKELLDGVMSRQGIPPEQIVLVGEHVCVVNYSPDPDGMGLEASRLRVYKVTNNGVSKLPAGDVAMYKADVELTDLPIGKALVIKPNYGQDKPIVIPIGNAEQVKRLLALTHKKGLFSHRPLDYEISETFVH